MHEIATKIVLTMMLASITAFSGAAEIAPDALLSAVTSEVITIIRQDNRQDASPTNIAHLIESKVVPYFDFTRMTRVALARNWSLASPDQRQALTAEFKTLLVRTYSTALSNYRDQVITFKPLRFTPADAEVTVKSEVKQAGSNPIAMDYDMEKTSEGWKVYDIKFDGVSLIINYRGTFAAEVRTGGVDGLIKSLSNKNREGDAAFEVSKTSAAGPHLLYAIVPQVLRKTGN